MGLSDLRLLKPWSFILRKQTKLEMKKHPAKISVDEWSAAHSAEQNTARLRPGDVSPGRAAWWCRQSGPRGSVCALSRDRFLCRGRNKGISPCGVSLTHPGLIRAVCSTSLVSCPPPHSSHSCLASHRQNWSLKRSRDFCPRVPSRSSWRTLSQCFSQQWRHQLQSSCWRLGMMCLCFTMVASLRSQTWPWLFLESLEAPGQKGQGWSRSSHTPAGGLRGRKRASYDPNVRDAQCTLRGGCTGSDAFRLLLNLYWTIGDLQYC